MSQRLMQGRRRLPSLDDYGLGKDRTFSWPALATFFGCKVAHLKILLVGSGLYAVDLERQSVEEATVRINPHTGEPCAPRLMLAPTAEAWEKGWVAGAAGQVVTALGRQHLRDHLMRGAAK